MLNAVYKLDIAEGVLKPLLLEFDQFADEIGCELVEVIYKGGLEISIDEGGSYLEHRHAGTFTIYGWGPYIGNAIIQGDFDPSSINIQRWDSAPQKPKVINDCF